jgi:hypothetical protein
MWVFTNHGFYSIVRILDTNPEEFWIRSTINKEELIDLFTHLPQEIDYTNFKDSIKDVELKDAAHYVWHDIYGVLDERKGTMGFSEEERSWPFTKNRKPDGSRNTGLSSDTQGKNGVVRIEDWKRK